MLSNNPGEQVNVFKNKLGGQAYFGTNLSSPNGLKLASLSPPQIANDAKPYVLFSLECRFIDKTP